MTRIIFLGTNGWYDTETGNTISVLIDYDDYSIVLDAGIGIYKLDRYIDFNKPVYIFLSHFHLDHIYGLHILNKFPFNKGLFIFSHKGSREILNIILNKPFTVPLDKLPFKTEIIEVPDETGLLPFDAEVLPMTHSSYTLGLRLKIEGKIISYCPDTGYCDNALILSKNADILIAECAYKGMETDNNWPHLNPESAASIAKNSGSKKLYLVHFDASRYINADNRKEAEKFARKIFPETNASYDGLSLKF